ncbi:MAG: alpha/beta fold hydrolase [Clostridiales bacterium]|nr:alpha/beta fold hydrolase [Clostridiales bacterium]
MKEFYIEDDGIKLHAKLDMPAGYKEGEKCPLAIVIHGLTGHMEETHIIAVAETFNSLGIASLRVEMYGHGKSGGSFENHNLFKWLNNAMTVVDYAKTLDFVTDMYICGHSQGGVNAIMLAGMMPDIFRAAIPLSPAVMITEGARSGRILTGSFDPDHVPDEMWANSEQKVNGNYIRAAQMLDVDWAISHYKNPVLIVHGDEDEAIPVEYSREAAAKYSDAKLVIIPGDDHCYNYHLDQVLEAVKTFMETVMR